MGKKIPLKMSDGTVLMATQYKAQTDRPLGVLLHVHGMSEHSGRYEAHWNQLSSRGISVLTYDHRGHGLSGGHRASLGSWDRLCTDLREVVASQGDFLGQHYIVFAHSMGAIATITTVLSGKIQPMGVILSSPAFMPGVGIKPWQRLAARTLAAIVPNLPLPKGKGGEDLMSLPEEQRRYRNDPLINHMILPATYTSLFNAGRLALDGASSWVLPLLLIYGDRDAVADPKAMSQFYANVASTQKELFVEAQGLHELLFDFCRERVLNEIIRWMGQLWTTQEKT